MQKRLQNEGGSVLRVMLFYEHVREKFKLRGRWND